MKKEEEEEEARERGRRTSVLRSFSNSFSWMTREEFSGASISYLIVLISLITLRYASSSSSWLGVVDGFSSICRRRRRGFPGRRTIEEVPLTPGREERKAIGFVAIL